jgi:hypothetical protein
MTWLRTVVLEHQAPGGVHYDWLLEPPPSQPLPEGRLWAVRVPLPPSLWTAEGSLDLELLPPHRREYLDYEGPLSGGRGSVRRIASGTFWPRLWTPQRMRLDVRLGELRAEAELFGVSQNHWRVMVQAALLPPATPPR